jgi:hypothetical protein
MTLNVAYGSHAFVVSTAQGIWFYLNRLLNPETLVLQEDSAACSCLDCEASCPGSGGLAPLPTDDTEEFLVAGWYGLGFIMCIVYILLALTFLVLLFIFHRVKCELFVKLMHQQIKSMS